MPDRRRFLAASIGVAGLGARSATAPAPQSPPSPPALEVDDDQAIRDILRRRVDLERRSVGMAVCVVTPERTRFVAWGRERLSDDQGIRAETVFEIGSITKVFTALLLAAMAKRGEVEIDDPVERHLPGDFHLPKLDDRPITLGDLATHTSGLPRFPPVSGAPLSPAWIAALARMTVDDFKAWLAHFRPPRPAGAAWEYSNAGYALLGMALSYRGGRPCEALLQARVIDAVGLPDTSFSPALGAQSRLAESHDAALRHVAPFDGGIFLAAGGLRSTPRDLARFAAAVLPGAGSAITPEAQALLTVRRAAPWIGGMQALGWEVRDAPGGAFVCKDGVTWGQTASIVYDPERRLAIVVFSNAFPDLAASTPSGGGIGAADLARHLLRPQIPLSGRAGTVY
jgi:serine-type D-Ala-D-Ala carboxypeptidase/endopeptidase